MNKAITFLVKYPIWSNVVLYSILGFGVIALLQMRYSSFPEVQSGIVTIQVAYPGASPQEVEEGVVLKIEENLEGIEDIERITSFSRENFGTVNVEAIYGVDIDRVLADVKNAVDRINSFPQGSEKPVVYEMKFRSRTLSVVLYGDTDLFNLKVFAENLREDIFS